jgi:hypothetical protein
MNFLAKKVKKTEVNQLAFTPDEADRSIVGLRNLVGSRPEGMAPVSIMESMHQLTNLIGSLPEGEEDKSVIQLIRESSIQLTATEVHHIWDILSRHGTDLSVLVNGMLEGISKQIVERFENVDNFLHHWTTFNGGLPVYGERLTAKIDTLEAKVNSIASSVPLRPGPPRPIFDMRLGGSPARAPHANFGMNGLSLGHNQPQQQPGSTDTMEKVMATVRMIQDEIAVLKEQMDDTVIDVTGQRFNTKKELEAWLIINTRLPEEELVKGKTDIQILFADAMGLFGLIAEDYGGSRNMTFKVQSRKAGFASTEDALFMSSSEGSLPKLFGTTRTDIRTLPKAKDHTMFDSGN